MLRLALTAALSPLALSSCAILESSPGPAVILTAATNPTSLAAGDTARIVIAVKNTGDRVVFVHTPTCNMDFFITDGSGTAYTPAEQVYCTLALSGPIELAPGESVRLENFTTGRVVPQGSQEQAFRLSPGTYRIRPVVTVSRGDGDDVVVTTDPMTIVLR